MIATMPSRAEGHPVGIEDRDDRDGPDVVDDGEREHEHPGRGRKATTEDRDDA
jgi:hypothetical protein